MTVSISGTGGVTFPDNSVQTTAATGFGFKNRIINGAMVIDQRNAGAEVSPAPSGFGLDRWATYKGGAGTWKIQQSTDAPAGFKNSALLTVTSASTPSGNDYYILMQPIEGNNTFDLAWGTASAQTVTLSFWVKSSVTGTFGGALRNSAENRTYPFTFSISSASTWEQKSVSIVGDTSGTWLTTNGRGITLDFSLGGAGTSLTTAGAWSASGASGATGQTNLIATSGATFYITGVQLEKGSTATAFDYRPYGTELALCQRYYWRTVASAAYTAFGNGWNSTSTGGQAIVKNPITMRIGPTSIDYSGLGSLVLGVSNTAISSVSVGSTGTDVITITYSGTGMTTGFTTICANNNLSAYLGFSAEL